MANKKRSLAITTEQREKLIEKLKDPKVVRETIHKITKDKIGV